MYQCIACKRVWGDYVDLEGYYSHGLCSDCVKEHFRDRYHQEQRNFSGNPCFGAPREYSCEENTCKYKEMCRSFTDFPEDVS